MWGPYEHRHHQVCLSALDDIQAMIKLPGNIFLRKCLIIKQHITMHYQELLLKIKRKNCLYIQPLGSILMTSSYVRKDQFQKVVYCAIAKNSGMTVIEDKESNSRPLRVRSKEGVGCGSTVVIRRISLCSIYL